MSAAVAELTAKQRCANGLGKTTDARHVTQRALVAAPAHQGLSGNLQEAIHCGDPRGQVESGPSLLCRDPSLLMNRARWAAERCLFPFGEWPLGILADIQGEISYTIGHLYG